MTSRVALVTGGRVRLITGRALDVLPRLSDGGYDMVFADGAKQEYADYLAEAIRLLRVGGIVVAEVLHSNGFAVTFEPARKSVLLVLLANVLVAGYARGVVRAALDEGVRAGARAEDAAAECARRAAAVLDDLIAGPMRDPHSLQST